MNPRRKVLVILHGLHKEPPSQVLDVLRKGDDVSLFILSDEKLRHSTRKYGEARIIFRNYYSPYGAWHGNVFVLPLGYTTGYERVRGAEISGSRSTPWAFFGQVKNADRQQMLAAFERVCWLAGEPEVHLTQKWNDPEALEPRMAAAKLRKSVFVPCPRGNLNPDTFRVMEALEAGSIPVVTSFFGFDYFRLTFGDHPFVTAESWHSAAKECQRLLDNPDELQQRLSEVSEWYSRFVEHLQTDVATLIKGDGASRLKSPQFAYQKRAKWSPRVRLAFIRHFRLSLARRKILGHIDALRRRCAFLDSSFSRFGPGKSDSNA